MIPSVPNRRYTTPYGSTNSTSSPHTYSKDSPMNNSADLARESRIANEANAAEKARMEHLKQERLRATKEGAKSKLKEKQMKLQIDNESIIRIETELRRLSLELVKYQQALKAATTKLEYNANENIAASETARRVKTQEGETKSKLLQAHRHSGDLNLNLSRAKEEHSRITNSIAVLRTEMVNLKRDMEGNHRRAVDEEFKHKQETIKEGAKNHEEERKLGNELESIKKEIADSNHRIVQSEMDTKNIDNEIKNLEGRVRDSEHSLSANSHETHSSSQTPAHASQILHPVHNLKLDEAQKNLDKDRSVISHLEIEISSNQTETISLKRELDEIERKIILNEKALEKLEKDRVETKLRIVRDEQLIADESKSQQVKVVEKSGNSRPMDEHRRTEELRFHDELKKKLEDAKRQKTNQESAIKVKKNQAATLNKKKDEIERNLEQAQKHSVKPTVVHSSTLPSASSGETAMRTLTEKLNKAERDIEQKNVDINKLTLEIKKQEETVHQTQTEIDEKQKILVDKENEIKKKEAEKLAQSREIENKKKAIADIQNKQKSLESQLNTFKKEKIMEENEVRQLSYQSK